MRAVDEVCESPTASVRQVSELVRQEPRRQCVPRQEPGNEQRGRKTDFLDAPDILGR